MCVLSTVLSGETFQLYIIFISKSKENQGQGNNILVTKKFGVQSFMEG